MKKENKETELLNKIGKHTIKYLDYVFLFIVFPFIFDVRFADPKVFIALGSLIVIRAIMPGAKSILKFEEEVTFIPEPKINPEVNPPVRPETPFVPQTVITYQSIIDTTNQQFKTIRFGEGAEQITIKKVDGDIILSDGPYDDKSQVVISFADFRTIRLKKDEVKQLYIALLESEYKFFKQGKWYLAITVRKQ